MTDPNAVSAELIAGKYRLTRLLGRGGMGSVWEGVHVSLGTRVACKFIEAEFAGSKEARDRFENEARAAAALRSKHVVEVYDHGVTADGRPYIVMEFLQGEPLDARIERRGALSVTETASILQQVARALSKAHAIGIVHRDLKPENVFLVWDDDDQADVAKVVDFGIAKFTDETLGISSQTRTGSILGTPFYMSPEQARGLRTVDARSDLWSLGVIAFQCMTGQLPFGGEALGDLLVKICTGDPPTPSSLRPELGPEVDEWVRHALAREASERFQSAREMANALSLAAGEPVRASQGSTFADDVAGAGGGPSRSDGLSSTAGALTNSALAKSTPAAGGLPSRALVVSAVAVTVLGIGVVAALAFGGGGEAADATAEPASAAVPEGQVTELVEPAPKVETIEPTHAKTGTDEPGDGETGSKGAPKPEPAEPTKAEAPKPPPPPPPPVAKAVRPKAPTSTPKQPAVASPPPAPRKPTPVDLGY